MRCASASAVGSSSSCGDHATDEADPQRLRGVDHLAGHEQLRGLLAPDELRESSEPGSVAHEPAQHEQLAELRLLGGDTEVGHERQLHAPPHGGAVHRGDDRDVGVQQRVGRWSEPRSARERAHVRGLLASSHHDLHVVPRAERGIGARDDEAARRRRADGVLELGVAAERERVARLGTPKGDDPDVALLFVGEVFVHRSPS